MKAFVFTIGIMISLVPLAIADEAELPAQKDTYVHEGTPTSNHGNREYLQVFADWAHPGAENPSYTLIRFDLAPYMGKVVDEAELRLYIIPTSFQNPGPGNVDIYRIDDGWDENIVTWNNMPPDNPHPTVTVPLPPHPDEWFVVPVTDFVQVWVDGVFPNHGFYLSIPNQGVEIFAEFASKEHPDHAIHSTLWLRYHTGPGISEARKDNAARFQVTPISNGTAEIQFSLPSPTTATIKIYDITGTLVETLVNGFVSSGEHLLTWNGAKAGVYFVYLTTLGYTYTKKLVLTR